MDKAISYGLVGCCIGIVICFLFWDRLGPSSSVLPLTLFTAGYLIAKLDENNLDNMTGSKNYAKEVRKKNGDFQNLEKGGEKNANGIWKCREGKDDDV